MPRRKNPRPEPKIGLDTFRQRMKRGRPGVFSSEIVSRADNYRQMFWTYRLNQKKKKWVREKPQEWVEELLKARTEDDLTQVLDSAPSEAQNEFNALIPTYSERLAGEDFPQETDSPS